MSTEMLERLAAALCAVADYPIEADVLARAALEEMREPTWAMEMAASDCDGHECASGGTHWCAMIDEALNPNPKVCYTIAIPLWPELHRGARDAAE